MALHEITEFYTKLFRVCTNITTKFRTIAIFESSVLENDINKTCRYVHDIGLYRTLFVQV
jgi:hypothetical protein